MPREVHVIEFGLKLTLHEVPLGQGAEQHERQRKSLKPLPKDTRARVDFMTSRTASLLPRDSAKFSSKWHNMCRERAASRAPGARIRRVTRGLGRRSARRVDAKGAVVLGESLATPAFGAPLAKSNRELYGAPATTTMRRMTPLLHCASQRQTCRGASQSDATNVPTGLSRGFAALHGSLGLALAQRWGVARRG
jgi:hypothetical protein